LVIFSALNNLTTPSRSQISDELSAEEKARIREAFHLRQTLGNEVWAGWGSADIPMIVYNEEDAFLLGYPDPPSGWVRVPQMTAQGGAWEPVPDALIDGQTYYRQHLPSSEARPQNFTVLVGERWVSSLQSKEWMLISLGNFLSENVPTPLRPIFPRGFVAQLFVGSSDKYISLALHESFHGYQGMTAPARLIAAEEAMSQGKSYPLDDAQFREAWQRDLNLLARAVQSKSETETKELVVQFLAARGARRSAQGLSAALVEFEREREWLEGLAKYTELAIWRLAAGTPGYKPSLAPEADSAFENYRTFELHWAQEVNQITLALGSEETLFYYSGMAQAVLLDRLAPDWKARIWREEIGLEDLLGSVNLSGN
jgi:hypothetical protein